MTQKRRDIQILRGLSVLAVIGYHFNEQIFQLGYLGVDVFFVISGYVILPKLVRPTEDLSMSCFFKDLRFFYQRRFWRLFPALIHSIVISGFVLFLLIPADYLDSIARQMLFSSTFLGNVGAWKLSGNYFNNLGNPFIHLWSLGVEMQIYIAFPILVFLFGLIVIKNQRFSTLILTILCSVASFLFFIIPEISNEFYKSLGINSVETFKFYSPIDRFWEFGSGGILALVLQKKVFIFRFIVFVFTTSIIIRLFFQFQNETIFTMVTVVFTVIAIGINIFDHTSKTFQEIFKWIGDRSYSIYLTHMPFIFILQSSPYFPQNQYFVNAVSALLTFVLILIVGDYIYRKSETRYIGDSEYQKKEKWRPLRKLYAHSSLVYVMASLMILGAEKNYLGFSTPPKH